MVLPDPVHPAPLPEVLDEELPRPRVEEAYAAIVPADPQEIVFHTTVRNANALFVANRQLFLDGPPARRRLHQPQAMAELDHLAARVRIDVEDGGAISIAGDLLEGARRNPQRGERNLREVALRLLVHPVDARAGKDVMELIEE